MTLLATGAGASTSAWDQPGTLGFLVVFGMGTILYFVFRSMSRHLKKVNAAAIAEAKPPTGSEADDLADKEPAAGNGALSGS